MKLLKTTTILTAVLGLTISAMAGPDMAHYKVPTLQAVTTFIDGCLRTVPRSEVERIPNSEHYAEQLNMTRYIGYHTEEQGEGQFHTVSPPIHVELYPPLGYRFIHPAKIAEWLAGALGRAFDSKYCETQFFVNVSDGGVQTYEGSLVPRQEWEQGGPSWWVSVRQYQTEADKAGGFN